MSAMLATGCRAAAMAVLGLGMSLTLATGAAAQQAPGAVPKAQQAQQPKAAAKPQAAPAAKAAPAPGGEAQLRQRIEQLEEQLVDMQVVVGTLESLARGGAGQAGPPARAGNAGAGLSAAEAGRLDGLETQIRALTAQLEQLSEQVRAMNGGQHQGGAPAQPSSRRAGVPEPRVEPTPRFGSQTVTPAPQGQDPIGGLLAEPRERELGRLPPAGPSDGNAKQLYETAYGYLLQQDYAAAESAFTDFLQRFPQDQLAGNAQYWLGESFYVRGSYKAAASAFLKGYQTYARSSKAPESLLKLAMSLDRLGQRDAACSSYNELGTRFPNAPAHVKSRAQTERARMGCA